MTLLIFSDTHNASGRMPAVLEREGIPDAVIFLGDGASDADVLAERYPRLPLYRVRGNCDFASLDPEQGRAAFGGVLFLYTHGHNYGVKTSLDNLLHAAKITKADVALYGHTHRPEYSLVNGVHLFNPGSLSIPRGSEASYGKIRIENGVPAFEICEYLPL